MADVAAGARVRPPDAAGARRALGVACGAHAVHDGYTDLLLLLLPIWQAAFGLGYAEIGTLRSLYVGTMASLQIPAGWFADRVGLILVLAAGTIVAGSGFALAASSDGYVVLAAALVLGGIGASVQHPIASSIVARAYDGLRSRTALGTYNFAGDVGKMVLPAATALLLTLLPWRTTLWLLALVGILGGVLILAMAPAFLHRRRDAPAPDAAPRAAAAAAGTAPAHRAPRYGFPVLFSIGVLDSATRGGFLTFLPFLLTAKGASLPTVGLALTLVFAGGAAGKLICAQLGARLGVLTTVLLTEGLTAGGILALLPLPVEAGVLLLPLIGVALNGTSSVIYGSVPELVPESARTRSFGIFYTGTIGASAVAPVIYGMFGDALGVPMTMTIIAGLVLATLPLAVVLNPALPRRAAS